MFYVTMIDKFMSGWGQAEGKRNRLTIKCQTREQAEAIAKAARCRSEMRGVTICTSKPSAELDVHPSFKTFADMGGPWLDFYHPKGQP